MARHFLQEPTSHALPQRTVLAGRLSLAENDTNDRVLLGPAKLHLHEAAHSNPRRRHRLHPTALTTRPRCRSPLCDRSRDRLYVGGLQRRRHDTRRPPRARIHRARLSHRRHRARRHLRYRKSSALHSRARRPVSRRCRRRCSPSLYRLRAFLDASFTSPPAAMRPSADAIHPIDGCRGLTPHRERCIHRRIRSACCSGTSALTCSCAIRKAFDRR